MNSGKSSSRPDEVDILCAVWILSCNDDNPIMTYKSILDRLGLPVDFNIRDLVKGRRELFRLGILESRLEKWKAEMRTGKSLPGWLAELKPEDRLVEIERLNKDDVFRNQFRARQGDPRCSVEVIDWGLTHLDRIRAGRAERSEEKRKFISSVAVPVGSLVVAAISLVVSGAVGFRSINSQENLKRYEVSFKPKQEAYSTFMEEMMSAAIAANDRNKDLTLFHINKMEGALYHIEPFIKARPRAEIFARFTEFTEACAKFAKSSPNNKDAYEEFLVRSATIKKYFRGYLYSALFSAAE